MSYILSIYSTMAFKEYLLPAIDNSDYSLVIQSSLFGLSKDIEIPMEIIDGKWRIITNTECRFTYIPSKEPYVGNVISDGDVLSGTLAHGDLVSIIVKETDSSFAVSKKYSLSNVNEITIGKDDNNIFCYDSLNLVSRHHASIVRRKNTFIVEGSGANGIFVNSRRIAGATQLRFGDCIDIFGLRIVFLDGFIAVNTNIDNLKVAEHVLQEYVQPCSVQSENRGNSVQKNIMFHRAPRNIPKIENDSVEIEAPPTPRELNSQPTFLAIGPSLTMALPMLMGCALSVYATRLNGGTSSAFMYTGLVTAVGSAVIGTVWAILNMRHAKKKNREDELKRFEAYSEYLIGMSNDIKRKYENNIKGMGELYPSSEKCVLYNENSVELWNKNTRHEDFLAQRLGIGAVPFQVDITIPKERFSLINDSLAEKPRLIKESYKMLHDVPVCLDLLKHRMVGVIGGKNKEGCYTVLNNLVAQIAAGNCYTDVKMIFVYDEALGYNESKWGFAKWLPHVWSEDKKTRFVAGNKVEASDIFYEITKVLRQRAEDSKSYSANKTDIKKPYYILFLESAEFLEGELIAKYITDTDENLGISTVLMVQGYEDLPNSCEYIVENSTNYSGMYGIADGVADRINIKFDLLSAAQLERFARHLSCIEVSEIETGGEVPNVLTFFDMYGVSHLDEFNVMDRWRKNRTYETIKALVGQKAGGTGCYLDVHEKYHGPHGLVAGTTGSGKSETLQTYMLSLALNYSPDDIGFFVIDYKGGGMANLFEGLPHMIGQISNLSGNQVHRAMVSIKSENVRRQRIFSEHGVNNINLYTRLYKNNEAKEPVPHMFIIIDEFAELKREEPEFMRELISVAQVGRSLGVHLILATQKPAGTVDDNIWSNSKFRLCLRVQDRQDSTDMLHRPDAAYITQAGRCYMQVGNDELFELFQSAWSGAAYDEDAGAVQTDIAKMLSDNGKAAIVGSHAQIKQREKVKMIWISQLVEMIDEIAAEQASDINASIYDNTTLTNFVSAFFEKVANKGIDYPYSDYNMHRVQDLITVYAIIYENCIGANSEVKATKIIAKAVDEGKKLPEMKEKTQLDALVEYIGKIANENGFVRNHKLWLDVLKTEIYLEELQGYTTYVFDGQNWPKKPKGFSLDTMIGLYDDPVNQAQRPISIDIAANGNCAIIGTVVSGKSTLLMTYIYSLVNRYSPETVNLYILDFSSKMLGAFEKLAHVGGVVYENDDEKIARFFTMLESMLAERKNMFKGGSYSQYIQANGTIVPAVVIVIDNMAAFRNKTNMKYDDLLMTLLKEGSGYGIFFIVTAASFGSSEIPNRMADNFRNVMCLEMNDKYAYSDVLRTLHIDVMPEENVKGRGLAKVGDSVLEYQTALSIRAEDDYKRGEMIKLMCQRMNDAWSGKVARLIPEIPEKPVWNEFVSLDETVAMAKEGVKLPIGYDKKNAMVYGVNLADTYCYTVSGKGRTGKTNLLRVMMMSAVKMGGQVAVIDFDGSLKGVSEIIGAKYVDSCKLMFEFFTEIMPVFKERNTKKREYTTDGLSDEAVFEVMQQFEKYFIFISDLPDFVGKVQNPDEGVGGMDGFVNNILEKGMLHNIYWFAGYNQDDVNSVSANNIFKVFVKDKHGIHLGGNVNQQRLFAFDHVPYNEQSKVQKPGIAMLPTHDDDDTQMVVIPLYTMD